MNKKGSTKKLKTFFIITGSVFAVVLAIGFFHSEFPRGKEEVIYITQLEDGNVLAMGIRRKKIHRVEAKLGRGTYDIIMSPTELVTIEGRHKNLDASFGDRIEFQWRGEIQVRQTLYFRGEITQVLEPATSTSWPATVDFPENYPPSPERFDPTIVIVDGRVIHDGKDVFTFTRTRLRSLRIFEYDKQHGDSPRITDVIGDGENYWVAVDETRQSKNENSVMIGVYSNFLILEEEDEMAVVVTDREELGLEDLEKETSDTKVLFRAAYDFSKREETN